MPNDSSERWVQVAPNAGDLRSVRQQFKRLIPVVDDCRLDSKGEFIPSNGRVPRNDELELISKWANNRGNAILQLAVREQAFKDCEGPPEHPRQLWFYRDHRGFARPLPGQSDADRLELAFPLAFGDLADDGHSEVLFFAKGYNRGGYALYYDELKKRVAFSWGYH